MGGERPARREGEDLCILVWTLFEAATLHVPKETTHDIQKTCIRPLSLWLACYGFTDTARVDHQLPQPVILHSSCDTPLLGLPLS